MLGGGRAGRCPCRDPNLGVRSAKKKAKRTDSGQSQQTNFGDDCKHVVCCSAGAKLRFLWPHGVFL